MSTRVYNLTEIVERLPRRPVAPVVVGRRRRVDRQLQPLHDGGQSFQAMSDSVVKSVMNYFALVAAGADPIEALHGHVCGPDCLHWPTMTEEARTRAMPAWELAQKQRR